MSVIQQNTRNAYIANPTATMFPYTFKINRKEDLLVQVDGETKILDVDYTVTGVGSQDGGGVVFATPMSGDEFVVIRRNMQIQRLTDYQNLGDLRSTTLNADLDNIVMMLQQFGSLIAQSIRVGDGYAAAVDPVLPKPEPSTLLGWNESGTRLVNRLVEDVGNGSFHADLPGAPQRLVTSKLRDEVSIKDAGASGDGGNDTVAVQRLNSAGVPAVYVPPGEYLSDVAPNFRVRGPGAVVVSGRRYTEADWMFGGWAARRTKRHLFANLPLKFPDFDAACVEAGESPNRIYPQSFAMDWRGNRIYVLYSGLDANQWHVVVAYDQWSHEYLGCFLVPFTTAGEGCYVRYRIGVPYFGVRNGSDFHEYRVDTLPANLSKPVPAFAVVGMALASQFSYDPGTDTIAVVDNAAILGRYNRRYTALIRDMTTGNVLDRVRLPLYLNSGLGAEPLSRDLPKKQSTAYQPPFMASGLGGAWNSLNPSSDPREPYAYNGAALFNLDGQVLAASVYYPDKAMAKLQSLLGQTFTRMENEGVVFGPNGKVYTLNVLLGPSDGEPHNGGCVIMEEFSEHPDAVDFADCSAPLRMSGAERTLDVPVWPRMGSNVGVNYYLNPLTGGMVQSWQEIIDVMKALDLRESGYYTTYDGNSGVNPGGIVAPWGERVPNAHHVHFTNISNTLFHIRISGARYNLTYSYSDDTQTLTLIEGAAGNIWSGKKWLALGDSITARDVGYVSQVSRILGIEYTNAGVPNSKMQVKPDDDSALQDASFCRITTGNFAQGYDLITVAFGTNDAGQSLPIGDLGDSGENTFFGAMELGYSNIMAVNPTAKVVFILPPYRTHGVGEAGVAPYRAAIKEFCASKNIPVILTNEEMGINAANATEFLEDGLHFSPAGAALHAQYIASKLLGSGASTGATSIDTFARSIGYGPSAYTVTNLNDVVGGQSRMIRWTGGATNAPIAGAGGVGLWVAYSTQSGYQLGFSFSQNRVFARGCSGGVWSHWVELTRTTTTANANTTLGAAHLNTTVEKANNTAYSYTIEAGLGARGDSIVVVNSGTAGDVTIVRDTGVALYEGGSDANVTVAPGTSVRLYRSDTADRWVAIR